MTTTVETVPSAVRADDAPAESPYVTANQIGAVRHVAGATVRLWVREGRFPRGRKFGRHWLWPRELLQAVADGSLPTPKPKGA